MMTYEIHVEPEGPIELLDDDGMVVTRERSMGALIDTIDGWIIDATKERQALLDQVTDLDTEIAALRRALADASEEAVR